MRSLSFGRIPFVTHHFISQYSMIDGGQAGVKINNFSAELIGGNLTVGSFFYPGQTIIQNKSMFGGSFGADVGNNEIRLCNYSVFQSGTVENNILGLKYKGRIINKIEYALHIMGTQYNTIDEENLFNYNNVAIEYLSGVANIFRNILNQNKSFYYNTGYGVEGILNWQMPLRNSNLLIGYEYVSPYYYSLMSPFLIKDIHILKVGAGKTFFKNRLRFNITQQINIKPQEKEIYAYNARWLSTILQLHWIVNDAVNLSVFHQRFEREINIENVQLMQISQMMGNVRIKKIFNSNHNCQVLYFQTKGHTDIWSINYTANIPVINKINALGGYNCLIQKEDDLSGFRAEVQYRVNDWLTQGLGSTYSRTKQADEIGGTYRGIIQVHSGLFLEYILQYGKFNNTLTDYFPGNFSDETWLSRVKIKWMW